MTIATILEKQPRINSVRKKRMYFHDVLSDLMMWGLNFQIGRGTLVSVARSQPFETMAALVVELVEVVELLLELNIYFTPPFSFSLQLLS